MILQMNDLIEFASGVCGNFCLKIGDVFFPEEDWFDGISSSFDQWIPALTAFASEERDTCRLSFSDGSCCAELFREADCVFVQGCRDGRQSFSGREIDFSVFLTSVVEGIAQYQQFTQIKYYSKEQKLLLQCIDLGDKHV